MSVQNHEVESAGTVFSYGSTADYTTATWTPIAEVIDGEPPMLKFKDVPTTHLTSANKAMTYQSGTVEGGDMKLKIRFSAAVYATLEGFKGVLKAYEVTFSDLGSTASTYKCNGYINEIGPKVGTIEDLVTFEITIKISGLGLFTAAT